MFEKESEKEPKKEPERAAGPSARGPAWGVLPVKDLEHAKERLMPLLTPEERQGLFAAMLADVAAALAASSLDGVVVVTNDAKAAALAAGLELTVLNEPANAGQTSAVTAGARWLEANGVGTMLALPADVPLVGPADIDALLAAHGDGPAITIAPAHDRLGSNAVLCSPPTLLPLRFGDNSFYPHLERAREAGVEPCVHVSEALELDIDHPADFERLLDSALPANTGEWVAASRFSLQSRH